MNSITELPLHKVLSIEGGTFRAAARGGRQDAAASAYSGTIGAEIELVPVMATVVASPSDAPLVADAQVVAGSPLHLTPAAKRTAHAQDTDGDGIADTVVFDTSGDGAADMYLPGVQRDTNGDGFADSLGADTNSDGNPDVFVKIFE